MEENQSIQVLVNGEHCQAVNGQGLVDFITGLGLHPVGILIERNGEALLRSEWDTTRMAENDRVEILRVVAGG